MLGMAGSLIDVGLWRLSESLQRRLDALTSEELAQYRSHPRLSAEIIRRWGPPSESIVEAVLQHHEREQEQGFPQGLAGAAIHPDAKILGLVDTYGGRSEEHTSELQPPSNLVCRPLPEKKKTKTLSH